MISVPAASHRNNKTVKQTTTCPTPTVDSVTKYITYVFGDDAIFSVFLGKNPTTGEKNYRLMIQEAPAGGSVSDPARQIGGWVSYNVNNLALSKSSLIDSNAESANEGQAIRQPERLNEKTLIFGRCNSLSNTGIKPYEIGRNDQS